MKKLTIVGDEKVLKMIQKENQIRFRKFNMISCIEDATEKEIVKEKEEIEERPYIKLEKKETIKHKK